MGSATRGALAGTRAALAELGRADLQVAEDLLAVGRVVGSSSQLRSALVDAEADAAQKRTLVESVFGGRISPDAVKLVNAAATRRWSTGDDFVAGLEDLGYRAAAVSAPEGLDIDAELFAFERAVASDAELELALGSKLSPLPSKLALVDRLLSGKASAQTLAIVRHLVEQPRGRRIGESLRHAASVVADQRGFDVATITKTSATANHCQAASAAWAVFGAQARDSVSQTTRARSASSRCRWRENTDRAAPPERRTPIHPTTSKSPAALPARLKAGMASRKTSGIHSATASGTLTKTSGRYSAATSVPTPSGGLIARPIPTRSVTVAVRIVSVGRGHAGPFPPARSIPSATSASSTVSTPGRPSRREISGSNGVPGSTSAGGPSAVTRPASRSAARVAQAATSSAS